jgi:hypothetical protein
MDGWWLHTYGNVQFYAPIPSGCQVTVSLFDANDGSFSGSTTQPCSSGSDFDGPGFGTFGIAWRAIVEVTWGYETKLTAQSPVQYT